MRELKNEKIYFKKWLDEKRNADMAWLENSLEKRTNPELLNEEFKSVISAAYLYDTPFNHD